MNYSKKLYSPASKRNAAGKSYTDLRPPVKALLGRPDCLQTVLSMVPHLIILAGGDTSEKPRCEVAPESVCALRGHHSVSKNAIRREDSRPAECARVRAY